MPGKTRKRNVGRVGRLDRYSEYVKPYLSDISEWCKTMTERQIAEKLGVGYSTFNQYKVDHEELVESIKNGRKTLVSDLHSSLIKRAHGYDYVEKKITTEAVKWDDDLYEELLHAGFSPEQIAKSRLVKTEVFHKKMPPDVAALNLALKNYDKENWANDPQTLEIKKKELELREKQIENNAW